MSAIKIGLILGTRPEAIKMAAFLSPPEGFEVRVCNTGQHRELITPMLDFFGYRDIHTLTACVPGQSLAELSARMLPEISTWLESTQPDVVFVKGDTQSSFIGALASFYQRYLLHILKQGYAQTIPTTPFLRK